MIEIKIPDRLMNKIIANARVRTQMHRNHPSHRPMAKDYEKTGLMGEVGLSLYIPHLQVDWSLKPKGDGGTDFRTANGNIDVKTAKKPFNLIHQEGKKFCDLYVLAGILGEDEVGLYGWHYGELFKQQPTKVFKFDIPNHYIPQADLLPMEWLKEKVT